MNWILIPALVGVFVYAIMMRSGRSEWKQRAYAWADMEKETFDELLVERSRRMDLVEANAKLKQEYSALDLGAQEVQEGYEQEFLTKDETIARLDRDLEAVTTSIHESYGPVFKTHFEMCLPDFLTIDLFEGFHSDVYEETPVYDSVVLDADYGRGLVDV